MLAVAPSFEEIEESMTTEHLCEVKDGQKIVGFKSQQFSENWPASHQDFRFMLMDKE